MRDRIDALLKDTVGKVRLSREEKAAYAQLLGEIGDDRRLLSHFSQSAFSLVREQIEDGKDLALLNWLEDTLKLASGRTITARQQATRAYFGPGNACRDTITAFLEGADESLDICVFTITDNRISDRIVAARQRGVSVRIITDDDKAEDLGSDIDSFVRHGLTVRVDETHHHMHHKFAVADASLVLTGSYNWTRSASEFNNENLVVISEQATVRAFQEEFEKLWTTMPLHRPR